MEKALAIIHHYGSGKADFAIRANGKIEWEGPGSEPTQEELEQWESERLTALEAISWIGNREAKYPAVNDLIVALWEKVIENRPEAADALEIDRQDVKIKHPKT
ncbi:hypothetical protein KAR91_23485 [Candidatus Pacearchaeota archaeon]|nr:hypothetical protein [Candidatus Pacearchaeota archaeon]